MNKCAKKIREMDEYVQLEKESVRLHNEADKATKAVSKFFGDMLSKLMLEREKQHLKELLDEMGE